MKRVKIRTFQHLSSIPLALRPGISRLLHSVVPDFGWLLENEAFAGHTSSLIYVFLDEDEQVVGLACFKIDQDNNGLYCRLDSAGGPGLFFLPDYKELVQEQVISLIEGLQKNFPFSQVAIDSPTRRWEDPQLSAGRVQECQRYVLFNIFASYQDYLGKIRSDLAHHIQKHWATLAKETSIVMNEQTALEQFLQDGRLSPAQYMKLTNDKNWASSILRADLFLSFEREGKLLALIPFIKNQVENQGGKYYFAIFTHFQDIPLIDPSLGTQYAILKFLEIPGSKSLTYLGQGASDLLIDRLLFHEFAPIRYQWRTPQASALSPDKGLPEKDGPPTASP